MTTLTRVEQLTAIQKEANELFSRKNADYGDAFAAYGTIGILVRLGDKIQRLQNIGTVAEFPECICMVSSHTYPVIRIKAARAIPMAISMT